MNGRGQCRGPVQRLVETEDQIALAALCCLGGLALALNVPVEHELDRPWWRAFSRLLKGHLLSQARRLVRQDDGVDLRQGATRERLLEEVVRHREDGGAGSEQREKLASQCVRREIVRVEQQKVAPFGRLERLHILQLISDCIGALLVRFPRAATIAEQEGLDRRDGAPCAGQRRTDHVQLRLVGIVHAQRVRPHPLDQPHVRQVHVDIRRQPIEPVHALGDVERFVQAGQNIAHIEDPLLVQEERSRGHRLVDNAQSPCHLPHGRRARRGRHLGIASLVAATVARDQRRVPSVAGQGAQHRRDAEHRRWGSRVPEVPLWQPRP